MKAVNNHNLLIVVLLSLFMGSCAIHYLPVGEPGAQVINDTYLYRDEETELMARNSYWSREPQNLNDYFTTFYVRVTNITGEKIALSKGDFALLNEQGNQFDPLDVEQIEDILLHDELENIIIRNIEEIDSDEELVSLNEQRNFLEDWRKAKRNLLADSFNFGNIFPNASRTGYLFFPKVNIKNDELTLVYKEKPFKFRR